jgi:D-glycero-D-manno-heptose 1,7-bisphosphate phosphatase
MNGSPAVFFDRDGTLMEDAHYCGDPAKVKVYTGVPQALVRLKEAGFAIVVVSNQSGIGRGLMTEAQYHAVQAEFLRQLEPARIDASYFCPDAPGPPSACRKPAPGMVLAAAADLHLDPAQSWMVGDKSADIECGQRAGARSILVLTGYGAEQNCRPDFIAADAVEAVAMILASPRQVPARSIP